MLFQMRFTRAWNLSFEMTEKNVVGGGLGAVVEPVFKESKAILPPANCLKDLSMDKRGWHWFCRH